jgi:hypothetical protein
VRCRGAREEEKRGEETERKRREEERNDRWAHCHVLPMLARYVPWNP